VETIKPAESRYAKVLIHGPMGNGKTRLLGTAQLDPRSTPALFLNYEGGEQTLSGLDIDMVNINNQEDFHKVYVELLHGTKYKSICIDSISEVEFGDLMDIVDEAHSRRQPKEQDLIQQGDYGKGHVRLQKFVRQFRDLPYHVFMSAGSQDAMEPRVGMIKKPQLTGKMADQIPAILDVVGYLAIVEDNSTQPATVTRSLILKNNPSFRVKIRTPWNITDAPDEIEDPDVGKLLDVLHIGKPTK